MNTPVLDAPGKGLPYIETLLTRYWFLPRYSGTMSWDESKQLFLTEGQKILELTQPYEASDLEKRILIPRLKGMEDSSRFWSMAMTQEHLIQVGKGIAHIICSLAKNQSPEIEVNIAKVKPQGNLRAQECRQTFQIFLDETFSLISDPQLNRESVKMWRHPWFGFLNPHEWNWILAVHQRTHRKQIEKIINALKLGT